MIKVEPEEHRNKENNSMDVQEKEQQVDAQEVEAEAEAKDPYKDISREELIELLKQKDQKIARLNEKILRMAAEMDNTRKRLERERNEAVAYANEQILRELLPVIDNLERAISHANSETDPKALLEGVEITLRSFLSTLERFGCTPFESVGKPFDPSYHEAIMQQETEEYPENTVLQEYQKGYMLKDRLLRPAMVVVARSVKEKKQDEEG
ncbi:nucleotide exchange factor GrpE [Thermodesulforhabdus norvegica]|uniref:Protein GrpE n=1 Tax=Thermodesulforhabdus norvegica TaxID=39841 RepID=A0A1I4R1H3_9BACT|nr:nucleotide exchange factor GrpE [Thermodesulforhabdus norvegica]SFM46164.1 molecular chaperone GrpE [Thermodesulforhabdus norvegica]